MPRGGTDDHGGRVERMPLLTRRHTIGSVLGPSSPEAESEPTSSSVRRNSTTTNGKRRPSYTLIPLVEEEENDALSAFVKAARVIRITWSEERKSAYLSVVLVLGLGAAHTFLSVFTSYAERDLTTALATRNQPDFVEALLKFFGIILFAVPINAGYYFFTERLTLRWRSILTRHLLRLVLQRVRDKDRPSRVDNIDQRICEDAASFTSRFVDLSLLLFKYSISTISFTLILWKIAKELVFILVVYAAAGTYVAVVVFSKKLSKLAYETSLNEGNLRVGVVRKEPLERITAVLDGLMDVLSARITWNTRLEVFTSIYSVSLPIDRLRIDRGEEHSFFAC